MAEQAQQHTTQKQPQMPTTSELVDRLMRFEGPPDQFLVYLLAVQSHVSAASGGAIIRQGQEGKPETIAVFPTPKQNQTAPVWLAQAVELAPEAFQSDTGMVKPVHGSEEMYGQPAKRHLIFLPLKSTAPVRGAAVFLVETGNQAVLAASRERLELTMAFLGLYEMRLTLQRNKLDVRRLRLSMETLNAVNEQDGFAGAAMALCNEIATRWNCDRVSLGFLKGRYVQLKALSHTEKFSRKMKLVQDLESAMEECIDQDLEVIHPAGEEATYVSRATATLSSKHGPSSVMSLPLRKGGEAVAVLTLERPPDQPFSEEDIEVLRLTADLVIPRLHPLYETDRWVGARAAAATRKGLAAVVGPKHTWIKVAVVLVTAAVLFLIFAKGDYTATGEFVLEPTDRAVVSAPFQGYFEEVRVEPGDKVAQGDLLVILDKTILQGQLREKEAQKQGFLIEARRSSRDARRGEGEDKLAEAQRAMARAEEVQAEIDLLKHRIEHSEIRAPIAGTVVSGDHKHRTHGDVDKGEELFEIAKLSELRAEVVVSEDQIADIWTKHRKGEEVTGTLATIDRPEKKIPFVVERVNPMAEIEEKDNVFKVRVRLLEAHTGMHAGMEGVAKIEIGKRSYGWIWTRQLVNWIRMKLWL